MTLEEIRKNYGQDIYVIVAVFFNKTEANLKEIGFCRNCQECKNGFCNSCYHDYDFELDQDVLKSIQILCPRLVKSYKKIGEE